MKRQEAGKQTKLCARATAYCVCRDLFRVPNPYIEPQPTSVHREPLGKCASHFEFVTHYTGHPCPRVRNRRTMVVRANEGAIWRTWALFLQTLCRLILKFRLLAFAASTCENENKMIQLRCPHSLSNGCKDMTGTSGSWFSWISPLSFSIY